MGILDQLGDNKVGEEEVIFPISDEEIIPPSGSIPGNKMNRRSFLGKFGTILGLGAGMVVVGSIGSNIYDTITEEHIKPNLPANFPPEKAEKFSKVIWGSHLYVPSNPANYSLDRMISTLADRGVENKTKEMEWFEIYLNSFPISPKLDTYSWYPDQSFGKFVLKALHQVYYKKFIECDDSNTTPSKEVVGGGKFLWPVQGHTHITGLYGEDRGDHKHAGIDIACENGTSVGSIADGKVIRAGRQQSHKNRWNSFLDSVLDIAGDETREYAYKEFKIDPTEGYGQYVMVDHGFNEDNKLIVSLYAHLDKINVEVKDQIKKGDIVGLSGDRGTSSGPHLHFEFKLDGKAVDPLLYLQTPKDKELQERRLVIGERVALALLTVLGVLHYFTRKGKEKLFNSLSEGES